VHTTESGGPALEDAIAYFQNPDTHNGAHYLVGQNAKIVQMVLHDQVAFHGGSDMDADSIAVEHVARGAAVLGADDPGMPPNDEQYYTSAALVSWLCDRYGLPKDRDHIVPATASDPDALWDWDRYLRMVTTGAMPAPVAAQALGLASARPRAIRVADRRLPRVLAFDQPLVFGATISSLPAVPTGAPWEDLLSYRPPVGFQSAVNGREPTPFTRLWHMQKIEDGYGPVNLDEYLIRVTGLPSGVASPDALLDYVRRNINALVDPSIAQFAPYDAGVDGPVWTSSSPAGAVIEIDMLDDGSVLCGESTSDHWIFCTIKAGRDGIHPVCGNRQFGYRTDGSDYLFYTRGADRAYGIEHWTAGDAVFSGGDDLWRSFQRGLSDWINSNGGSASIGSRFSERFDWDAIRGAYYHPTGSWV
jgi:hypothetical protein